MYYTLSTEGDEDGNITGFTFDDYDVGDKDWEPGKKFTDDETASARQKARSKRFGSIYKQGQEKAPLPDFMSQPSPLMSKKLLETVRAAGVKNIDAYPAVLYYADGELVSTDYFIINVIGVVKKTDEIVPNNDFQV